MKLLLNADVYGWKMTGLLGTGGVWFLGLSRQPARKPLADLCDCKGIVGDCGRCDGACKRLPAVPATIAR